MDYFEGLVDIAGGHLLGSLLVPCAFYVIALAVRGLDRLWWRWKGKVPAPR